MADHLRILQNQIHAATVNWKYKLIAILAVLFVVLGSAMLYFYVDSYGSEEEFTPRPPTIMGTNMSPAAKCGKRLVGYYEGSRVIQRNELNSLTHIIFRSDNPNLFHSQSSIESSIEFMRFVAQKNMARENGISMMVSVNYGDKDRQTFINEIAFVLDYYNLDGVDIDFENNIDAYSNLFLLLPELRQKLAEMEENRLRDTSYIISLWVPPYGSFLETLDFKGLSEYVDFVNVGTSDYHKENGIRTPLAPLYVGQNVLENRNVNWTMSFLEEKTNRPGYFNMEIGFHGISYFYRDGEHSLLNPRLKYNRMDGKTLKAHSWNEKMKSSSWLSLNGKAMYFYEDPKSITEKMKYFYEHRIGGITVSELDSDDDQSTMFNTIAQFQFCVLPEQKTEVAGFFTDDF